MATNFPTLVTTRYVTAGAYIGQLIVPSPSITPDTRIPCYVGVGSRFAVARNRSIRRSFVFDRELSFSTVPPYTAQLPFEAANDKSLARLMKADGTEVKINQWQFLKNGNDKYMLVQINGEVFDPVTTYTISYQSVDRNVLDSFPVADIREFMSVGDGPDANDYEEYQHYFADFVIAGDVDSDDPLRLVPGASNNPASLESTVEDPVVVAGGTPVGVVTKHANSEFTHDYNRYYVVRCKTASGQTPNRVFGFEWSSKPVSAGNNSLPPVPLDPAAPKPTFEVAETVGQSVATSRNVQLEHGIELTFDFSGGDFAPGDAWGFNGLGPAIIEVDPRHANTNQHHDAGAIVKASGTGFGTLDYASTSEPSNTYNAKFKVECISASDTSTKASTEVLRSGIGLAWTAKVGGVAGNNLTVGLVDPGVPNSPLSVSVSVLESGYKAVTVLLGTDADGDLISTLADVEDAVAAMTGSPLSVATIGSDTTIASPVLSSTVDVTNGLTSVSNRVGTTNLTSELRANSVVKFSSDPSRTYSVEAVSANGMTISPAYAGTTKAAVALSGSVTLDEGSPEVIGDGTLFLSELEVGDQIKFSSQPSKIYVVASVADDTILTLTAPYTGTDAADASASIPGTEIIEVSTPLGKTQPGLDGVFGARLAWAEHGERIGVSGIADVSYEQGESTSNPTMSLSKGIALSVGLSDGPFSVGDVFSLEVKAPRQYYQGKDNRAVTLNTDAVTNPGAGRGAVSGSYVTNTPEGGFGVWSAEDNAVAPSNDSWKSGRMVMAGNILLAVRNMHVGPTTDQVSVNRHVAGNSFSFSATLNGTINWSLVSKASETIAYGSVLTDVLGAITGQASSSYVILANVPDAVVSVTNADTNAAIPYRTVSASAGKLTQYIVFDSKPEEDTNIKIKYLYRGAEPAPGQVYYMSSKHIRPDELYNQPILIRSLADGRRLLAPAEKTNHLFIMNEIAMGDIGAPAMYVVQVKDADGDGLYSNVDFADAIAASEAPKGISDLVVLSHFSTLAQQLNSVNKMADPFKRRFRMTWVGAPPGTDIGSEEEDNTLINLARRTLQVFGANPAHGTRVLVGSTEATRDLRLENNVVVEVALDGSFIAGALCALTASFADPAETLLRKTLPGFKTIKTYGEAESPQNLALGAANIVYFTDLGAGLYQINEDVTVDTFAPDFNLINNMTQKMYVVKQVRNEIDQKMIGLVVPSAAAGVGLIRGFVFQILSNLLGRNLIGRYQTPDGNERSISAKDVIVFRDQADPTLYHVLFAFYLKNEIKRVFGLYSVNSNDFGG